MSVKEYLLCRTGIVVGTDIFKLKKRLLLMSFMLRCFLNGVEYSIILPTAILYMKTFKAGTFFTGMTIAAYPAAAIISLPLFGYFYDRTKRTRELMLVLNLFEALGNLLYALPFSMWLPPLGRFISGLGDGFLVLMVGELTYLYPAKERLAILSFVEFGGVMGLILGPSFNFLIEGKRIAISTWILDNNTLPGVIMALLWCMMEIITIFCVFNLAKELIDLNRPTADESSALLDKENIEYHDENIMNWKSDKVDEFIDYNGDESGKESLSKHSSNESLFHPTLTKENYEPKRKYKDESETESELSLPSTPDQSNVGTGVFLEKTKLPGEYWESIKKIFCFEFIIITVADLMLWFCQTNFEILAPYITEFNYGWTPQITGLIYVFGGILIIIVFLALYVNNSMCFVKDTHLLIVSLVCTQISLALLIYESSENSLKARQGIFALICVFVFVSIPLNLVCSITLMTKLFRPEFIGMVQGISSGISRLTMITGPILSGYIFKDRITYAAVTSVFVFATIIAFFSGLNRIHRRQRDLRQEMKIKKFTSEH